jgi:hypothetical protein
MCLTCVGGPPNPNRWRMNMLCSDDNCLSPANIRLCSRGNITTGDLHSDAPAISLLAISFSLLVESTDHATMPPKKYVGPRSTAATPMAAPPARRGGGGWRRSGWRGFAMALFCSLDYDDLQRFAMIGSFRIWFVTV